MKKSTKILISIFAAIVVVILVGIGVVSDGFQNMDKVTTILTKKISTDADPKPEDESDKNKDGETSDDENGQDSSSNDKIVIGPILYEDHTEAGFPTVEPAEEPAITFPYQIPGTSLTVDGIKSYDGLFIENGSDVDVTGIPVLFITNNGDSDIELVNVSLIGYDGQRLDFSASGLSAGTQTAVQESNAQAFFAGPFKTVDAETSEGTAFEMNSDIAVVDNKDGTITVTNKSGADMPVVRIFYKFFYPEYNSYVGGITYTSMLENLGAGQSETISPSHYDSDASRIVMVKSYAN